MPLQPLHMYTVLWETMAVSQSRCGMEKGHVKEGFQEEVSCKLLPERCVLLTRSGKGNRELV